MLPNIPREKYYLTPKVNSVEVGKPRELLKCCNQLTPWHHSFLFLRGSTLNTPTAERSAPERSTAPAGSRQEPSSLEEPPGALLASSCAAGEIDAQCCPVTRPVARPSTRGGSPPRGGCRLCLCPRGTTFAQGLAGGHRLVGWGVSGESAEVGAGGRWDEGEGRRKTKFGRRVSVQTRGSASRSRTQLLRSQTVPPCRSPSCKHLPGRAKGASGDITAQFTSGHGSSCRGDGRAPRLRRRRGKGGVTGLADASLHPYSPGRAGERAGAAAASAREGRGRRWGRGSDRGHPRARVRPQPKGSERAAGRLAL